MPCVGGVCSRRGKAPAQQPVAQPQAQQQSPSPMSLTGAPLQGQQPQQPQQARLAHPLLPDFQLDPNESYYGQRWGWTPEMSQNMINNTLSSNRNAEAMERVRTGQPLQPGDQRYQTPNAQPPYSIYHGSDTPPFKPGVPMFVRDPNNPSGYREVKPNDYKSSFLKSLGLGGDSGGSGGGMPAENPATQIPIYRPDQEKIMNALQSMGAEQANQYYGSNPYDFEPQAEAARRGFEQKTIPSIMSRYTGMMGGRGGTRSSGLQQQFAQAGQDLESNLGALRSQYGIASGGLRQQGIGQLLGAGLVPRYDTLYSSRDRGPSTSDVIKQGIGSTIPIAVRLGIKGMTGI